MSCASDKVLIKLTSWNWSRKLFHLFKFSDVENEQVKNTRCNSYSFQNTQNMFRTTKCRCRTNEHSCLFHQYINAILNAKNTKTNFVYLNLHKWNLSWIYIQLKKKLSKSRLELKTVVNDLQIYALYRMPANISSRKAREQCVCLSTFFNTKYKFTTKT